MTTNLIKLNNKLYISNIDPTSNTFRLPEGSMCLDATSLTMYKYTKKEFKNIYTLDPENSIFHKNLLVKESFITSNINEPDNDIHIQDNNIIFNSNDYYLKLVKLSDSSKFNIEVYANDNTLKNVIVVAANDTTFTNNVNIEDVLTVNSDDTSKQISLRSNKITFINDKYKVYLDQSDTISKFYIQVYDRNASAVASEIIIDKDSYDLNFNSESALNIESGSKIGKLFNKNIIVDTDSNLDINGYQQLGPNGLLFQWATFTSTTSDDETFTFPKEFNSSCFNIQITPIDADTSTDIGTFGNITNVTTSGFTFNRDDNVGDGNFTFYCYAIGV